MSYFWPEQKGTQSRQSQLMFERERKLISGDCGTDPVLESLAKERNVLRSKAKKFPLPFIFFPVPGVPLVEQSHLVWHIEITLYLKKDMYIKLK